MSNRLFVIVHTNQHGRRRTHSTRVYTDRAEAEQRAFDQAAWMAVYDLPDRWDVHELRPVNPDAAAALRKELGVSNLTRVDKERIAEHASPQAIEVHLAKARRDAAQATGLVAWYEDLLAERQAQVAAGTWPPHLTSTTPPTTKQEPRWR